MSSFEWSEIDRVYLEASGLPPTERANFLDRACAGQSTLRSEVESLLHADDARGDFLEFPPSRLAADLLETRHAGPAFIGRYRILGVLRPR
jgi:hypothetical protein